MAKDRRPSAQTIAVLSAFAADPGEWRYGYQLGQEVGLRAGVLYPILMRLSDRGLLEAGWESEPPVGRPPRHWYRLTRAGAEFAEQFISASSAPEPAEVRKATGSASQPAGGVLRRPPGSPRGAW